MDSAIYSDITGRAYTYHDEQSRREAEQRRRIDDVTHKQRRPTDAMVGNPRSGGTGKG